MKNFSLYKWTTNTKRKDGSHHSPRETLTEMSGPLVWLLSKKEWKVVSVDEDVEKLEPLYIAHGNVKWYSHCGKEFGSYSKELPYSPVIHS